MADQTVNELKVALFDLLEKQAVYQAEFNKIEVEKTELAKRLGEARQQEAAEKQDKAVRSNRPHTRDE